MTWPIPPKYQDRLKAMQGYYAGSPFARAIDPRSSGYGAVEINDVLFQPWWDLVYSGELPGTAEGAAIFAEWKSVYENRGFNPPMPTEIITFFDQVPQMNAIYRALDNSQRGNDLVEVNLALAKREQMIKALQFTRRAAYLQVHGLPPNAEAWDLAPAIAGAENIRESSARLAYLLKYVAAAADQYALAANIDPPFRGITSDDVAKIYFRAVGARIPDSVLPEVRFPTDIITPVVTPLPPLPAPIGIPRQDGTPTTPKTGPSNAGTDAIGVNTVLPAPTPDPEPSGAKIFFLVVAGLGALYFIVKKGR